MRVLCRLGTENGTDPDPRIYVGLVAAMPPNVRAENFGGRRLILLVQMFRLNQQLTWPALRCRNHGLE
ncbi:hypothetical protein G6O67_004628 [Ophiocordyceps sinensis]|uniref:Uncharacterized protein n=1 Tax=Ophiocordyceps sinensis TaxID=72228 RepID=A0A8H4V4W5_9HYPO|nr:hypothetical protein G6O67_004628 [Ophiocordyceps sinensis]